MSKLSFAVLALSAGAISFSPVAFAQLPQLQPRQELSVPSDPAPQPPEDLPVHFGERVFTDGQTAIVTVDRGRAAYAYIRNAQGQWVYETELAPPTADYTFTGGAVLADTALVQGLRGPISVAFVFVRTAPGVWINTQTLPDAGNASDHNYVAIGNDFAVLGRPSFNGAEGGLAIYDKVGTGTYDYYTTLQAADATEGFLTGINPVVDGNTVMASSPGAGLVHVFVRNNNGVWREQAALGRPGEGLAAHRFSFSNNRAVLHFQSLQVNPVVFVRAHGEWTEEAELQHPTDPTGSLSVLTAIDGRRLIATDRALNTAYLYERNGTTWTPTAELPGIAPTTCGSDDDQSIAISGRIAFASCATTATPDPEFDGRVLVYRLPAIDTTE